MSNCSDEFRAEIINCEVSYKKGNIDYEVLKLMDIKREIKYFKTTNSYINNFIDYMKCNVIKKLKNLNLVKIYLNIFDKNNILHRLIVNISNMLRDLLKYKEKFTFNKSVFVAITYENKLVFTGRLDFNDLN
jgi:hypothetical protein